MGEVDAKLAAMIARNVKAIAERQERTRDLCGDWRTNQPPNTEPAPGSGPE